MDPLVMALIGAVIIIAISNLIAAVFIVKYVKETSNNVLIVKILFATSITTIIICMLLLDICRGAI